MERYTDNSKMHILVIPAWLPSLHDRAAGTFIIGQVIALSESPEIRIGVIYNAPHRVPDSLIEYLSDRGVPTVIRKGWYIPKVYSWSIALWCRAYFRVYKRYVKQYGAPHVLHAHSYIAGLAAYDISRRTGIPFMITEHSTNFLTGGIRRWHILPVRAMFESAYAVLAVGSALQQQLQHWVKKPVLLVPNSYDDALFFPDRSTVKRNQFTIVTIGSLIPRKRIDLLLHAFGKIRERISDTRLVIVGSGPEEKSLKQMARELSLAQSLTWMPFLPQAEIAELLRCSHVLVSVSTAETFGLTIVEALGCGIPVVATRSGGPEEFVSVDQGTLVPIEATPNEIATAVIEVYQKYQTYHPEEIAQNVQKQFGRRVLVNRLQKIYKDISATRRP